MTTATKSLSEQLLQQWNDLGAKTATLGAEFPAGDFEERPVEGVRSVGEVFRHLAFWNRWLAATARGESADGSANELPKKEAASKAKALSVFDDSVAEAAAALAAKNGRQGPSDDLCAQYAAFLGHTSEHYGQLVVYARLRGIVPPSSR